MNKNVQPLGCVVARNDKSMHTYPVKTCDGSCQWDMLGGHCLRCGYVEDEPLGGIDYHRIGQALLFAGRLWEMYFLHRGNRNEVNKCLSQVIAASGLTFRSADLEFKFRNTISIGEIRVGEWDGLCFECLAFDKPPASR